MKGGSVILLLAVLVLDQGAVAGSIHVAVVRRRSPSARADRDCPCTRRSDGRSGRIFRGPRCVHRSHRQAHERGRLDTGCYGTQGRPHPAMLAVRIRDALEESVAVTCQFVEGVSRSRPTYAQLSSSSMSSQSQGPPLKQLFQDSVEEDEVGVWDCVTLGAGVGEKIKIGVVVAVGVEVTVQSRGSCAIARAFP
jgi:hypothetical protein